MTLKLQWSYTVNTPKLGAFQLMQVLNGLLLQTISWKHFPRVAVCKSNVPPKRLVARAEYWWGVLESPFWSEPTLVNADLHSTCKLKTRQFAIRRSVRRRWRTGDAYNWNNFFSTKVAHSHLPSYGVRSRGWFWHFTALQARANNQWGIKPLLLLFLYYVLWLWKYAENMGR